MFLGTSAFGPGCVKTRMKSDNKKIGLSERPLCDFLQTGKGNPTHENFKFLRFYTALGQEQLFKISVLLTLRANHI